MLAAQRNPWLMVQSTEAGMSMLDRVVELNNSETTKAALELPMASRLLDERVFMKALDSKNSVSLLELLRVGCSHEAPVEVRFAVTQMIPQLISGGQARVIIKHFQDMRLEEASAPFPAAVDGKPLSITLQGSSDTWAVPWKDRVDKECEKL